MNNEDNVQATPFNFAMVYYLNLNNRITIKDDAYMNNDAYGYYKGLDRIYNLISFKIIEEDEKEKTTNIVELDKWFKDAKEKLITRQSKKEIIEILHKIDRRLMELMNKYKMIFPNIESTHGLDALQKKYKLSTK